MKKCSNCKKNTIPILQVFLLAFGLSIKCKNCGSKLKTNIVAQTINSIFLTVLTVGLLVILTNNFGMIGFVMAFVIPIFFDVLVSFFLPTEVAK